MQAKLSDVFRDQRYVYAKLSISGCGSLLRENITVISDSGVALPFRLIQLARQDDLQPDTSEALLVMPLLFSGTLNIALSAFESSQQQVLRITPARAKWSSRLVRRLGKTAVTELTNMANQVSRKHIAIEFDCTIPDEQLLLVRGSIELPFFGDSNLIVDVFDQQGDLVADGPVFLSDLTKKSHHDPALTIRKRDFTFRIPLEAKGCTVAARDESHPELMEFFSLGPGALAELWEKGKPLWNNAFLDGSYDKRALAQRVSNYELEIQRQAVFPCNYTFSIVVPLFNTPIDLFTAMVESVRAQSYANWELVLVNASPDNEALSTAVQTAASQDTRILFTVLRENLGITENTNVGIAACTGNFVCFLDHDDTLEPDALYEYNLALNNHPDIDLLYCDEDKMDNEGKHFFEPYFKPDFDMFFLRTNNYICHFLCVRKSMIDKLEPPKSEYDGAQDHHLTLRVAESARRIFHVSKVLYHWRATSVSAASAKAKKKDAIKPYANQAGKLAIEQHLLRSNISGEVTFGPRPFIHLVKYLVHGNPLVSIIIPNKDCATLLERCVHSIIEKTNYRDYEIIIVDNNSVESETHECYDRLIAHDARIRMVSWPSEFNFSSIVNYGAQHAKGSYYLLLNNDTEVISPEWLENMLGICQLDDVGAVGAQLLYPDRTFQHTGIVITDTWTGGHHAFSRLPETNFGYCANTVLTHECVAVTAACLLTDRATFECVGGFTEDLSVAFNDVDYCLKVRERGLKVVYEPTAKLYHYESATRGYDLEDSSKYVRLINEGAKLHSRWTEQYVAGDPYLNPNLATAYYVLG